MRAFLIGLGIVLVMLVAAVLVIPALLDWNDHRDWFAARLGAWTGSTVAIHGDLSVRTLPAPALVAEDVHIASRPGAAHDDLLTVGTLRVTVPWLPLLGGEIAVERLTLVEPRLILERRDGPGLGLPALTATGAAGAGVRLADLRIENGTLIRHDPESEAGDLRLQRIFAAVSAESLAGPFAATAEFLAADIPLRMEARGGRLSPAGALPLNLRLAIDGVDGTLRFAGLLEADGGAQGDLRLENLDPAAALAPHVPDPVPPGLLPALGGHRLNGRSNLAYDGGQLSLSDLSLDAGETRAAGTVTWRLGDRAALEADLTVNRVDFDADWAAARGPIARALAGLSQARQPDAEGGLTARLGFGVDAVRINQGLVRNIRLRSGWADGLLTLERASAELPGGSAAALAGTVAWSGALPEADLR
ncbi:MAG: AsmA family protein, partial [Alphaproteobacteria bacterium]|nr:AsmA family protein [Alphaproteobacteria bacterium]